MVVQPKGRVNVTLPRRTTLPVAVGRNQTSGFGHTVLARALVRWVAQPPVWEYDGYMSDRPIPPSTLLPSDPTIEVATGVRPQTNFPPPSGFVARRGACAALIEGSQPELTGETRCLLQARLRTAAIVLSVGFAAFLVRHFFA